MAYNKKFKIKGLKEKDSFSDASGIILRQKLKSVFSEIAKYNSDDSPDNLHSLRIASRRFRYNLEIFYDCLKPGLFKYIYEKVKNMQDTMGELRDLHVFEDKISKMQADIGQETSFYFLNKFSEEQKVINKKIQEELSKFISDDQIKKLLIK